MTKHLLTDTTDWGSDCTVNIHCWHYRLTVIDCTQKIYNTNNWKCIKLHTVTSHHHQLTLTVINCHWQPTTDIDRHQLPLTVVNCHRQSLTDTDSYQLTLLDCTVTYWPGPDFTGRYGKPSFRAWISSALNTSNSSVSLRVGWNWLYTGNGATN